MKHYIAAKAGSDEWRVQFGEIRDHFISGFESALSKHAVVTFKAFDQEDKEPVDLVFKMTDSAMLYKPEGNADDAMSYLKNMINQGMRVAYCISPDSIGWLTCWETPAEEPEWPFRGEPKAQSIFLGVKSLNPQM